MEGMTFTEIRRLPKEFEAWAGNPLRYSLLMEKALLVRAWAVDSH